MTTDREVCYITREVVQQAIEDKTTLRNAGRIDRCIASASRDVEGLTHRKFYPWAGTRYKNWPTNTGPNYKLWLDADEVISVSALTVDDGSVDSSDYYLEPQSYGPPYNAIELNRDTSTTFSGSPLQRNVAITGVFAGCALRESDCGSLAVTANDSVTSWTVTNGSLPGVGHILRVGTERVQVTDKIAVNTSQTINAELGAQNNQQTVLVDDGTSFYAGETILLDAERMRIEAVTGNTLAVRRAVDGTVLATHANAAAVWAYRGLIVARGALGTVAAAHNSADPLLAFEPPSLVQELTLAYALNAFSQSQSAYARVIGSGDNQREAPGRGVRDIERDCYRAFGRKGRIRSS